MKRQRHNTVARHNDPKNSHSHRGAALALPDSSLNAMSKTTTWFRHCSFARLLIVVIGVIICTILIATNTIGIFEGSSSSNVTSSNNTPACVKLNDYVTRHLDPDRVEESDTGRAATTVTATARRFVAPQDSVCNWNNLSRGKCDPSIFASVEDLSRQLGDGRALDGHEVRSMYKCMLEYGKKYAAMLRAQGYSACSTAQRLVEFRYVVMQYARRRGSWLAEQALRIRDLFKYGSLDRSSVGFNGMFARYKSKHNVVDTDESSRERVCEHMIEGSTRSSTFFDTNFGVTSEGQKQ
jgi:hypothetical protein